MTYAVRFTPEAQAQLDALESYIAEAASPAVAARYVDAIVDYCVSLQTFPQRGTRRDDLRPGLRTLGFERRVTIVFEITQDAVHIIGIYYGGQDYEGLLKGNLTPETLRQFVEPILGLPAWSVRQGYGSYLTFEFGEPTLEVRERRSKDGELHRSANARGRWHLWLDCCHWRVLQNDEQIAWSEDDRTVIEKATYHLSGQKLTSVEVDPDNGRSTFCFDLGGRLETWPYGNDPTYTQWMWFVGEQVFVYREDGRFRYGPSNEPYDDMSWSSFDE